jgi:hypothetical protein
MAIATTRVARIMALVIEATKTTMLLALLGVVLRVIMARGKSTPARRPTLISLSPELKPAKKVNGKRHS